ncbi:MAG: hypothetical protein OXG35_05550 [Acidobacteria bacterium]|nr:hypothetical protein [Acidobacteriota bacterium]
MRPIFALLALLVAAPAVAQTVPPNLDYTHRARCQQNMAQRYQITTGPPLASSRNWPDFRVSISYEDSRSVFSVFMWLDELMVMGTAGLMRFVDGEVTLFPDSTYELWITCQSSSYYRVLFDTAGTPAFTHLGTERTMRAGERFDANAELLALDREAQVERFLAAAPRP